MDRHSPFLVNFVRDAAEWATDTKVYSDESILITSDVYYGSTNQRKFKLGDNIHTWSELDYMPIASGAGSGNTSYAIFTTVGADQTYTVSELSGKTTDDILNIIMGQTTIAYGKYSLSGTTLTFVDAVPNAKRTIVYFKT